MTYTTGQLVEASDYNGFVANNTNNVNSWWASGSGDSGWGQTALGTVSQGNLIYASNWASLIDVIKAAANHTGTSITSRTAPSSGELIVAMPNVGTDITSINSNRGNAVASGATNASWSGYSSVLSDTGVSNQNWTITWISTVTFESATQARYFFNAGGLIKIQMSKTSTGTTKDPYWNDLVSELGTAYLSGGIGSSQYINGNTYTGFTVLGYTGPVGALEILPYGWYDLGSGNTEVLHLRQTSGSYTSDYISISLSVIDAILTVTTVWSSPGLRGVPSNGISGGTETTSPFSSFGTAPAVVVSAIYPSSTYLTNTWGSVGIAEAVNVVTSTGPQPYYPLLVPSNNFYASTVTVPGVGSGGRGPASNPGYVLYNGNYNYIGVAPLLTTYYASSIFDGTQFTSPRNMVFTNLGEETSPVTMMSAYGLNTADFRSINIPITVDIIANIDDSGYYGYYDVTIGATPSISDIIGATWHYMASVGYPAYDRQYNQPTSFVLPVPPVGHMYILAMGDNQGSDNIRWSINANIVAFTTSGSWTIPSGVSSIDVLVVGGGGGGGDNGGGGGGGTVYRAALPVSGGQTYNITIGAGGSHSAKSMTQAATGYRQAPGYYNGSSWVIDVWYGSSTAYDGGTTTITGPGGTVTAYGGGAGNIPNSNPAALIGSSGGSPIFDGTIGVPGAVGTGGTYYYANDGGGTSAHGGSNEGSGGGGGGAGGAGSASLSANVVVGGAGINLVGYTVGGGGGGGGYRSVGGNPFPGSGNYGQDGGGRAGYLAGDRTSGVYNDGFIQSGDGALGTGGGGGGAQNGEIIYAMGAGTLPGSGGSGIVVIRWSS